MNQVATEVEPQQYSNVVSVIYEMIVIQSIRTGD